MKLKNLCILWIFMCQSIFINAAPPGTFQEIPASPFPTGSNPSSVSYSPLASGNLFAAVPNLGDNTVTVYLVDQTTGNFSPVSGSPFSTGFAPIWVAFSPIVGGNLFAAVTNQGDSTVSVYLVNQTTGAFTEVAGSPFATGTAPFGVQFSPLTTTGNLFASVANFGTNTVSVYQVNGSTGVFSEVAGSPFLSGTGANTKPVIAAFSPLVSGNLFAASTNYNTGEVSIYQVDQTTGAFSEIASSPIDIGINSFVVNFSPLASGKLFAGVTNYLGNLLNVFEVNQTTGDFTPVPGSPYTTGNGPQGFSYSPIVEGQLFAALANNSDNTLLVYVVDQSTGELIPVPGSPFATGVEPIEVSFSPFVAGNLFAAVNNSSDDTVSVYEVSFVAVEPPTNLTGCQGTSKFATQTQHFNVLTWDPPAGGTPVAFYEIFLASNPALSLGIVSAQAPLRFIDFCPVGEISTYSVVAVDVFGVASQPAQVVVTRYIKCKRCFR